ncbi:hypothetical protein LEP1GSC047_2889 [Leptospira inadai serovar Lyme str. 10]|uniref:Uncharacterized protein n=1 Tax=Leptospira inadai serovar Lyme str. 10 TaxID=1049790 RepID=V6HIC7_9LEPT|nr:hypothetical protein LEP1GSC047_2889 [Leptospira inadai serovar Lyme str. 10]
MIPWKPIIGETFQNNIFRRRKREAVPLLNVGMILVIVILIIILI